MPGTLITTTEVAALAGVGPTTVKRWVAQGLLHAARTAGRHRRFRRDDVELFLARRQLRIGTTAAVDRWVRMLVNDVRPLQVQQALLYLRAESPAWCAAGDFLGQVVEEITHRSATGKLAVAQDRVASVRLERALAWCAASMPIRPGAVRVLLATAEGDDDILGLALLELCLAERGWNVESLGRSPTSAVVERVRAGGLSMVGMSASSRSNDAEHLSCQLHQIVPVCRQSGVAVLLVGRGAWPDDFEHTLRATALGDLDSRLEPVETRGSRGVSRRRRARPRAPRSTRPASR